MKKLQYILLALVFIFGMSVLDTASAGEQRSKSKRSAQKSGKKSKSAKRSTSSSSRSSRARKSTSEKSPDRKTSTRSRSTSSPNKSSSVKRSRAGSSSSASDKGSSGSATRSRVTRNPSPKVNKPSTDDRYQRSTRESSSRSTSTSSRTNKSSDQSRRSVQRSRSSSSRSYSNPQPDVKRTTPPVVQRNRSGSITTSRSRSAYDDKRPSNGGYSTGNRSTSVRTRTDVKRTAVHRSKASATKYDRNLTIRRRGGSFDYSRNKRAYDDRSKVGRISLHYRNGYKDGHSNVTKVKGGRYERFNWAKPHYARNNYRFVTVYNNQCRIQRDYLIHHDGRWGHAPHRYNGRNWHFYISLSTAGFRFETGYSGWHRRYYGDGWDTRFGWSSSACLPVGSYQHGTLYYEPNYAFSFTFNHGYETGYIEGFNRGREDWNYNRSYYSTNYGVSGYFSELGPYYEYSDGYDQGYSQGYYAGYSGYQYGWENFGYGDFSQYPVIYDFDYDYYENQAYGYNDAYEYSDGYNN